VQSLDLQEGDEIDLQVIGPRTLAVERSPESEELLGRLRRYRGRLPAGFRFDRLEANSR
jgi:antitoxin MazE